MINKTQRGEKARLHYEDLGVENRAFFDFVLEQYINLGVDELEDENL